MTSQQQRRSGDNLIMPRRCDAPDCEALTTLFVATEATPTAPARILHYCAAHLAWAAHASGVEGWWKEEGKENNGGSGGGAA